MNKLKQRLNDSLNELELSPQAAAAILAQTPAPKATGHRISRAAIPLLAVLALSCVTAAAVNLRSWGHTEQGFMTWEEYQADGSYTAPPPLSWETNEERYVLNYHLDIPAYSRGFTWEQANRLFHYRNGQKDSVGGGVFSYDRLEDAYEELGVCYLQSDALSLDGPVSMRAAGSHRTYQLVARYKLSDTVKGRSIFVEAILHEGAATEFIISTYPEQIPEMADCHLENLDTDVTLVKLSDTSVMFLLLVDTVSYNGSIQFDQSPENLFAASVDVLQSLHP